MSQPGIDRLEREVVASEIARDPNAPLLRALLDHCRLVEGRAGISTADINRVCHDAAAGSMAAVAMLVRACLWRYALVAGVSGVALLALGFAGGWAMFG